MEDSNAVRERLVDLRQRSEALWGYL